MRYPDLASMMQRLIAAPSVSSVSPVWDQSNRQVIEHLADWCRDAGFHVEILPIPGKEDKFNLIATAGSGPEGLVLSGHTDTVPFDAQRWQTDPFVLTERDGRWYGLGTADMKGFFAVVLEAIRELDLGQLKHPLVLLATADEESSMCGARALLDLHRQLGRHAVIGEPTGLRPVRMHKGIAMEALRVIGQSGHSSNPELGNNALEGMHRIMADLLSWRDELQARYRNPLFEVDVPTLNLGHIHGGDNPNRICGECELHFDLRPLPGMSLDGLRDELDVRLRRLALDTGLTIERKPLFDGIPAMETSAGAAIVRAVEELTDHPAQAVAFGTEGPFLNALGMETVVLGPGNIDQAHQPDEYLALDQLEPAMAIIRGLVRRLCLD
ncbi:MAG: acetylornithine deacetylase [Gammaproteobacteria bacterium]|nr:MAG: acetylornithine deacetylase [Gammaproteobacteria bacterium]